MFWISTIIKKSYFMLTLSNTFSSSRNAWKENIFVWHIIYTMRNYLKELEFKLNNNKNKKPITSIKIVGFEKIYDKISQN